MRRRLLLAYQFVTGLSDTSTGLLLIFAPSLTLRLMKLHAATEALPFVSYVGVFVLSVGIACFYGGWVAARSVKASQMAAKMEVVWLLTGITRLLVAAFILSSILCMTLQTGWLTVAVTDGVIALLQFYGLVRGWLKRVEA